MYERFYELRERPFALSPDPDYLYPSRVHREALDYLRYGLESHAGFVIITGEIGSGKTTLLQTLLRGLDSQTTVARIVNTMLEPRELLETILIDFGLEPAGKSKPLLLRDLAQYLVDQRLAGRMVLLVIDEAQNLTPGALEELRMLSNLETEKSKLLQIVLVGQPNLRDKLATPELEQLRQRITVSYHLQPLDADETENYINHRLRRAAVGAPVVFPREATEMIHARSRGVPRIINIICDAALVFGYAEERRTINLALVQEVLAELELTGVLPAALAMSAVDSAPAAAPMPVSAAAVPAAVGSGAAPQVRAADARASAALLQDLSIRAAELDQREQAIRQRERELAEQRRILAEEYRLLRSRTASTPHGYTPPQNLRVQVQAPLLVDDHRHVSVWQRVKRMMLGASSPAME
jgi:putative secretion ATPase (PEP-CTERM system associated)